MKEFALVLVMMFPDSGRVIASETSPPQRFQTYEECQSTAIERMWTADDHKIAFTCLEVPDGA